MASETAQYRMHHSMIRVKDPKKSLDFYVRLLGLRLCARRDFAEAKFSLYFLAYVSSDTKIPTDQDEAFEWVFSQQSHFIELTHNHGTENDEAFAYHTGNKEPKGFGHFCVVVPDVDKAVNRLEKEGVKILKKPQGGTMKGLAFVEDPDGYWIEIVKDRQLK